MKIAKVEAIPICISMNEPSVLAKSRHDEIISVMVRIVMDNGIEGYGEARMPGPSLSPETTETTTMMIERYFGPALVGQDGTAIEQAVSSLTNVRSGHTFTKAAIDMALYDALGKHAGLPVVALLGGGACKPEVGLIGWIGIAEPAVMAKKAAAFVDAGFKTIKIKIGTRDLEADVDRVRLARQAIGPNVNLRVDVNGAYTTQNVLRVLRRIEEYQPQLIEDPLPEWDLPHAAELARIVDTPICIDSAIRSPQDAYRIITSGAADIIKIKIVKVGGFTNGMKIIAIAEAAGVPVVVGRGTCGDFEAIAEAHLLASSANTIRDGEMVGPSKLTDHVVKNPIDMSRSSVTLSDAPGFGLEIKPDALRKYRFEDRVLAVGKL